MGWNTNITICNDNLSDYDRRPELFTKTITDAAATMGQVETWGITVHQPDHADNTQLIAVGANCSTKVHTTYFVPPHHTEEGQVAILRSWAQSLGYDIHKRT